MIADRDVFVVGEERLVGTEELADTSGVMDGSVEVSVVGDVDRFLESGSGNGVEGSSSLFFVLRVCISTEDGSKSFAE